MLSRVAESIYWLARYIERAENVARIMDANYHMILDLPQGIGEQWEPLVVTTGDDDLFISKFDTDGDYLWAVTMGGPGKDDPYGIETDSAGNVLINGYFESTADFDPGFFHFRCGGYLTKTL